MAQTDAWHYAVGEASRGPFTEAQLRGLLADGTISGETLIWSEELGAWRPYGETRLASASAPPPLGAPRSAVPSVGVTPARPRVRTFGEAVRAFFSGYATFQGRANRPEYWYATLFLIIVGLTTGIVDVLLFGSQPISPVNTLFSLATVVPSISVTVRRLHDIDRTGWWFWLWLLPIVGWIVLMVFWCQRGTEGPNRFGPA
jgi:uncharacterized membrane protein YhaH (DUF805 family)